MNSVDKETDNIRVVKTMLANGITGQWDIVKPLVCDEFVCHVPEGLPYGGIYRGWEGYMSVLKALSFWTDLSIGPTQFADTGDTVVVISHWKGRIAKNGLEVSMPLVELWQLSNGKVAKIVAFYYDTKVIADLATQQPTAR